MVGGHRLMTFQVEGHVLRGSDEEAQAIGEFALELFAAMDGRQPTGRAISAAPAPRSRPRAVPRRRSSCPPPRTADLDGPVIFDLDGVLVDSEIWWDDVRRDFAREHGRTWTEDDRASVMGANSRAWSRTMRRAAGPGPRPRDHRAGDRRRGRRPLPARGRAVHRRARSMRSGASPPIARWRWPRRRIREVIDSRPRRHRAARPVPRRRLVGRGRPRKAGPGRLPGRGRGPWRRPGRLPRRRGLVQRRDGGEGSRDDRRPRPERERPARARHRTSWPTSSWSGWPTWSRGRSRSVGQARTRRASGRDRVGGRVDGRSPRRRARRPRRPAHPSRPSDDPVLGLAARRLRADPGVYAHPNSRAASGSPTGRPSTASTTCRGPTRSSLMAILPFRPRLFFFGPKEEDMLTGGRNRVMHWTGTTIPYKPGKNDLLDGDSTGRGGHQGRRGRGHRRRGPDRRRTSPSCCRSTTGRRSSRCARTSPSCRSPSVGTIWLRFGGRVTVRVGEPIVIAGRPDRATIAATSETCGPGWLAPPRRCPGRGAARAAWAAG